MKKEKTNIKTILMYVVGIFLIISMATYLGQNLLVAILMGLLGIAILPPVNEKINERWIKGNKNKNTAKIILEVALFFLIVALVPRTVETSSEQIAKGENLIVNNVEENTQNTINTVNVTNATNTTNTQSEEQSTNVSVENTIKETAQPKQEEPKSSTPSSYSSTASSSSKASTSTSTSSSTQSKSTKQTTSSSTTKQSSSGSSTSSSSSTQNSQTVYVTPTGKRYHLSPTCGGKNSTATTLSNAKSMGLTPCKKCAQ